MFRSITHLVLHALVPAMVARVGYRGRAWRAFAIMMATMIVDLDHLLATPVYDPNRCSIGTHPLHTTPAILVYAGLLAFPKTRLVGLGLGIHMVLDTLDCVWMRAM